MSARVSELSTGFPPFPQNQIPGRFQGFSRAKMLIFQGRVLRHQLARYTILAENNSTVG